MSEVIELKEPFSYMLEGTKHAGVRWAKGTDYVNFWASGEVWVNSVREGPTRAELKTLMIMWLSLEYPEVINFDVE